MVISYLEHGEDSFERIIRRSADVYRELIIPVGNSSNVSGSEKDVAGQSPMARSSFDLESRQRRMRQKLNIGDQSGYRLAFAVLSQITQSDMRGFWRAR